MARENVYRANRSVSRPRSFGRLSSLQDARLGDQLDGLMLRIGEGAREACDSFELLARSVFANIVQDTPVDTGRARAGWEFNPVQETNNRIEFQIFNEVPYIIFLEFGSSRQAPRGMVRINIRRSRGMLRGMYRNIERAARR